MTKEHEIKKQIIEEEYKARLVYDVWRGLNDLMDAGIKFNGIEEGIEYLDSLFDKRYTK